MKNKFPTRTCVYTKEKHNKSELIRLVKNENNIYILDEKMKMQKRAIYIYPSQKSLILLDKNKKYKILDEDILKIKEMISEKIKVGEMNVK